MPSSRPRSSDFVSRISNDSFDGWRVRIDRKDTPYVNRHFSLAAYGTEQAAEQAAREFRQSLDFQVPPNGAHLHDPRNPHKLVGVTLSISRSANGAITRVSWRADWWAGRSCRKQFSVLKYGWRTAFSKAFAARDRNAWAGVEGAPSAPSPTHEVWQWARARNCKELPQPAS